MFIDVAKQHKAISEFANTALLKNSNKIEKNYDILFESANKLDSLKENILAIKKAIPHSCIASYQDKAKEIAKYRLKLVDELKESIDRRLVGLNSEMQVENLRFNRWYSLLVGLLIVIQIALAALTIDWGKLSDRLSSSLREIDSKEQKQDVTDKDKHNQALAVDAQKAARP